MSIDELITRDLRFAICPEWVAKHPKLSHGAVRLYTVLAIYAGNTHQAWPSNRTLQEDTGMSLSSLHRAIRDLERLDIIIRHERKRESGQQTSNICTVRVVPPWLGAAGGYRP